MSSRMNFDDTVSDKFEFQVGGKDFDLKYPTLTELEPLETKIKKITESKDSEEIKTVQLNAVIIEGIREFVTPVGHEESLEEVLKTVPITVSRKLNQKLVELLFQGE